VRITAKSTTRRWL